MRQLKTFGLLVLIAMLSGCTSNESKSEESYVVCTTSILADICTNLLHDVTEVKSIMGPGVDPHLYKASHRDVELLTSAYVIVYNGLHLEGKMAEVLEKLGQTQRVHALADGLDKADLRPLNLEAQLYDPHVWFDLELMTDGVAHLRDKFVEDFPDQKEVILANYVTFLGQMKSTLLKSRTQVQALPAERRILITSHDAFSYFGRSMGFEVKGLQGISTLSESGLKDVTNMVNFIIDRDVNAVFVENSVPEKALRSVIDGCASKGKSVKIGGELYSDALGQPRTPEGTYLGMFEYNIETIVNGLQ